jgi:hypothetical protein
VVRRAITDHRINKVKKYLVLERPRYSELFPVCYLLVSRLNYGAFGGGGAHFFLPFFSGTQAGQPFESSSIFKQQSAL